MGSLGGAILRNRYARLAKDLPSIGKKLKKQPKNLTFPDFSKTVEIWLKSAR